MSLIKYLNDSASIAAYTNDFSTSAIEHQKKESV